jgi:hypothetical protein
MPTIFNQTAIISKDTVCLYGTKIPPSQMPTKDFILSLLNPVYTVTSHFSRIVTRPDNIFCIYDLFHGA